MDSVQTVDSEKSDPAASDLGSLDELFHTLASRLANTANVLTAWGGALLGSPRDSVRRRIEVAAGKIEEAVRALADGVSEPRKEGSGPGATARGAMESGTPPPGTEANDGPLGLRGRSEMISLVEFVGFLSTLSRDGVLQIQTGSEEFVLQFEQGALAFMAGSNPPELRVGEILVANKALSSAGLKSALEQAHKDEFMGETLLRLGMVDQSAVLDALTQQITQMFCRMHLVGTGFDFQFEEGTKVLYTPDIRLNIPHLLLEGARLKDQGEVVGGEANATSVAAQVESALDFDAAPEPSAKPASSPKRTPDSPAKQKPAARQTGSRAEARAELSPTVQETAEQAEQVDPTAYRTYIRKKIGAGDLVLPALPNSTGQLLSMCWQADVDSEKLAECIGGDQSLCAHLLRVANAAAYSPVTPISSVQLAITRLGVGKIREIALALTLDQEVFQLPGWQDVVRGLWQTAAITAGFATQLGARVLGSSARGSLLGLLQDIGKPIVLNMIHEYGTTHGERLSRPAAAQLVEEFHSKAGVCLAHKWDLPDWLSTIIEHHHNYEQAGEQRLEALVACLAYELALWAQDMAHNDPGDLWKLPWGELGLGARDLQSLEDERDKILEMAKTYGR